MIGNGVRREKSILGWCDLWWRSGGTTEAGFVTLTMSIPLWGRNGIYWFVWPPDWAWFLRSVTVLMEFWFLAVVASGLLSWGNFISSNITELIAQILFKLNWAGRWQSPDLNPIEHLWDVVEREIRIMDVQPTNLQQLRDAIMSLWTKISEECFQHLVEFMPRRIKAVLKAKGGPTRY